jgi:phosphoglycerate dehydrogenase-like enzyme
VSALMIVQADDVISRSITESVQGFDVTSGDNPAAPWQIDPSAEILVTRPFGSWRDAPAHMPEGWPFNLKWIQTQSAGMDAFPSWITRGVTVTVGRGLTAEPIAEYVMAAVLRFDKGLERLRVTTGNWHTSSAAQMTGSVAGKTLGIVGFGAIGQAVATRALALNMRVVVHKRTPPVESSNEIGWAASLPALLEQSDHLVLALPATNESRNMLDAAALAHCKPGLHLINVARGALIDQDALLAALNAQRLGGATLDVTTPEPLPDGHPLYAHPDVLITPHISWVGGGFERRFVDLFLRNLACYRAGEALEHVFQPERGY